MSNTLVNVDYNPKSVNIKSLAKLILKLSSEQQEALELLLDPQSMSILQESEKDIKTGRTIPIEKW